MAALCAFITASLNFPGRIPPRLSRRQAFTLFEVLVALAIIGVLSAIILPSVNGAIFQARDQRLLKTLHSVRKGVRVFYFDVHSVPSTLDQVIMPLEPGAQDLCDQDIPASRRRLWKGPYLSSGELPIIIDDDTIKTVLSRREVGDEGGEARVRVTVENVDSTLALRLDELEGDDGSLKDGVIQWKRIRGQDDAPRLFYEFPISGC